MNEIRTSKKKIIWITNVMLPVIAKHKGLQENCFGGWLTGTLNKLMENEEIDIFVCCPTVNKNEVGYGKLDNLQYYCFLESKKEIYNYSFEIEAVFKEIFEKYKPDILHIFGTEFPHSLSAINAFNNPDRTIINIQGLVSVYAKHYYSNLSFKEIYGFTFFDLVRGGNLYSQKKGFEKRGKYEIEAIKKAGHVIGRTDWDRACSKIINKDINYHFCNETLRDDFYSYQWDIQKCEKYSIFISQANYPIKGFHYLLEALAEVKNFYPKVRVYVAGNDITKNKTLEDKFRLTTYGKYLKNKIKLYSLEENILFVGKLNEVEMRKHYLNCNVFVSPSEIENSSNSVGEAMIMGVPVISSDVGGIKNLLAHQKEGYIYQHSAAYMLAYYILQVFSNDGLTVDMTQKARIHALNTHNKESNMIELLNIYNEMSC